LAVNRGSADRGLNASPMALASAVWKSEKAMTRERMFLGALVKAYSREVMEAKISEKASRT